MIHDFTNDINQNKIISPLQTTGNDYILHTGMIAFNVKKASLEDEELAGTMNDTNYQYANDAHDDELKDLDSHINPLLPKTSDNNVRFSDYTDISTGVPLVAEDFRGKRFEGLVISLRKDETGLIVCFPYGEGRHNEDLTLLFHKRFIEKEADKTRLQPNMNVEFSIGVHPGNFGQGLYGYVANNIIITKHGFTNKYMPM